MTAFLEKGVVEPSSFKTATKAPSGWCPICELRGLVPVLAFERAECLKRRPSRLRREMDVFLFRLLPGAAKVVSPRHLFSYSFLDIIGSLRVKQEIGDRAPQPPTIPDPSFQVRAM